MHRIETQLSISPTVRHVQFLADVFRQIGHDERAGFGPAPVYGCRLLNGPDGYADRSLPVVRVQAKSTN
jgi:hypothetical protein